MKIIDDRTDAQRETHTALVVMTDAFMSRWGRDCGMIPQGGVSVAAWACRPEDADTVEAWVRSRPEARRVRVVRAEGYRPRGAGECHVYVVDDGHRYATPGVHHE